MRLKKVGQKRKEGKKTYFNSKVVRLKAGKFQGRANGSWVFQFQSGAVKSKNNMVYNNLYLYFNSKVVRLKVQMPLNALSIQFYFNSKVVRLKGHSYLRCLH